MGEKRLKIDYDMAQRDDTNDNLLMICEKVDSEDSEIKTENSQDDVTYEVHDENGIHYIVKSETQSPSGTAALISPSTNNAENCQYFVLKNETDIAGPTPAKKPCLILPKPPNFQNDSEPLVQLNHQPKKRDDLRRATHNEVERRRRDKINEWIFKLKDLLPDEEMDRSNAVTVAAAICKNNQNYSKSGILTKACDYIKEIQSELSRLKKCLNNSENLQRENTTLKSENELLKNEIEQLKNSNSLNHHRKVVRETTSTSVSSTYNVST